MIDNLIVTAWRYRPFRLRENAFQSWVLVDWTKAIALIASVNKLRMLAMHLSGGTPIVLGMSNRKARVSAKAISPPAR